MNDLFDRFKEAGLEVLKDEPLSRHTTFRVGGPCDYFVTAGSEAQIADCIRICREADTKLIIFGNGSNVLVTDKGVRGVILCLSGLSEIHVDKESCLASCEAGASLGVFVKKCADEGLAGLEFAGGIPGTLGGGIYMNAGAYGGELSERLVSARLLDADGHILEVSAADMHLGYRDSRPMHTGEIVLSAAFSLEKDDPEAIRMRIRELNERRRSKQPLEYPSAGSTFKRPEGYFAGKLIEDAGLKGFSIGGAEVSEKHAGFIINKNNATAEDILRLIDEVKRRVYEASGVRLEPEVRIIGER